MNARSAVNKAAHIHDVVADHRLDVAVNTESWIPSLDAVQLDIAPAAGLQRAPRSPRLINSTDRNGGAIHRDSVKATIVDMGTCTPCSSYCVHVLTRPRAQSSPLACRPTCRPQKVG